MMPFDILWLAMYLLVGPCNFESEPSVPAVFAAIVVAVPEALTRRLSLTALPLEITGDRGFTVAEATAGGVPLTEVRLETMESRICPGLFFAGEVLDVDGRIGGFNFQWAWASGFVAGRAAAS